MNRDTPIMPWEAYAFYRTRLVDLVHFVRAQFPGTPLMFRTETYMSKGTNAQIYNMRQSAEYVMDQLDVPLFTCGWFWLLVCDLAVMRTDADGTLHLGARRGREADWGERHEWVTSVVSCQSAEC